MGLQNWVRLGGHFVLPIDLGSRPAYSEELS